jgi:hypothetical protein
LTGRGFAVVVVCALVDVGALVVEDCVPVPGPPPPQPATTTAPTRAVARNGLLPMRERSMLL